MTSPFDRFIPSKPGTEANAVQEGGDHYKALNPQPWDVIRAWGLGFFAGNVLKYIARYRRKGGVEDLKKARHYLDKLIEDEEAQQVMPFRPGGTD